MFYFANSSVFSALKSGVVLPLVGAVLLTGCAPAGPRAQLMTSSAVASSDTAAMDAETHGEVHPNTVENFVQFQSGDRRLQAVSAGEINPASELMVTDVKVVEDAKRTAPGGAWHFGTLMEKMSGKKNPSDFVMKWLQTWEVNQVINGDVSDARPAIKSRIINPWLSASGGRRLNLDRAPFRLLAIVNRIDLRTAGNAGEARFVYGVLDEAGQPLPFTVIFEYGVPLARVSSVQAWAKRWHDLNKHPLGSPAYNAALESITDAFTASNANPRKPNGSALNQLRTNENALSFAWDLREFQIVKNGTLKQVTVKQSPKESLNAKAELAKFVKANQKAILAGTHRIPAKLLGAASSQNVDRWEVKGVSEPVRKAFAVATCIGCHSSETQTFFLHVGTRAAGQEAFLSDFVRRIELPARSKDLARLL
jgi:hypothetical protein